MTERNRQDILDAVEHIRRSNPEINYEEEIVKSTKDIEKLKNALRTIEKIKEQMNENSRNPGS